MLTRCFQWELGSTVAQANELTQRLQEITHTEALLVLSKTSFPPEWGLGHWCTLVDGPSRFIRIYFSLGPAPLRLQSRREEHASWIREFGNLRWSAENGEDWRVPAQTLRAQILAHLDWEESEVFPALDSFLLNSRPTREMLYEHQGIRRFLPGLEGALASLGKDRGWERFSLDLVHLLEHHIEHEEQGLYPVYERLLEGGKGESEVQYAERLV